MGEITPIDKRMSQVEDDIRAIKATQIAQADLQARYRQILFGDVETESPGVLRRITVLEKLMEASADERQAQKTMIKGILVGLGLTSITGIGTLATLLAQLLRGVSP